MHRISPKLVLDELPLSNSPFARWIRVHPASFLCALRVNAFSPFSRNSLMSRYSSKRCGVKEANRSLRSTFFSPTAWFVQNNAVVIMACAMPARVCRADSAFRVALHLITAQTGTKEVHPCFYAKGFYRNSVRDSESFHVVVTCADALSPPQQPAQGRAGSSRLESSRSERVNRPNPAPEPGARRALPPSPRGQ